MDYDFWLKQGDRLPVVRAQLTELDSGVNLSGAQVRFAYRQGTGEWAVKEADLVDAAKREVVYEWGEGDTAVPGDYEAEFRVELQDGRSFTAPNGPETKPYINYRIFGQTVDETALEDLYGALRHLLQDEGEINDMSLAEGIKTMVRMGVLKGYKLNTRRTAVTPALENPNHLALLLYKTAKSFVVPRPDRGSIRTRAYSFAHGSYAAFLQEIDEQIDELENGKALFGASNNFGNWLLLSSGLDVYQSGLAKLPCVTVPQTATIFLSCACWPVENVY